MTEDEQKIREIGLQVQYEYKMGGLSDGLYMDFATDVALRFSMHESKKYHAEKKELIQQIQSLQEENIKLAGELKYLTDKFPHNELGWKTKEEEINQLKCTHEVFNMSACVACGFKRTNDNEID